MTRTQLAAIAGVALIVINSVIMIAASGRAEAQDGSADAPVANAGEASHLRVEGREVVEAKLIEAGMPARSCQYRHELRGC